MLKDLINKNNYSTDKFSTHSYLEVYESVLPQRKDSAKNLLEIGVNDGGSIRLWKDYFTSAKICGVDISRQAIIQDERVDLIYGNAYDMKFIHEHFVSKNIKFDIIIDDGPHTLDSMQFFARNYSMLLAQNGVMILEDIQEENWVNQIIPYFMGMKTKFLDLRSVKNRYDDLVIIAE